MAVNLLELQQNKNTVLKCKTINARGADQDLVFVSREKNIVIGKFYTSNNLELNREKEPNPVNENLYAHSFKGELYENMEDKTEYYNRVDILIEKLKTDKSIGLISAITLDNVVVDKFKKAGLNVLFVPISKMEGEDNEKLNASFGNAIIFDQSQVPDTFNPLVIIGKTPQSAGWRKEKPEETKPHVATSMYLTTEAGQALGMSYLAHLSSLEERLESLKDVWVHLKANYKLFVSAGRNNGKDHDTSVFPNEGVVLANIIPALRVEKKAMEEMLNELGLKYKFPDIWTMFFELPIKIPTIDIVVAKAPLYKVVPLTLDSVICSDDLEIGNIEVPDNQTTGTQNKPIIFNLRTLENTESANIPTNIEKVLKDIIFKYVQKESSGMERAIYMPSLILSLSILIGMGAFYVSQQFNQSNRAAAPTQDQIQK